jgi:hypothetical protein
MPLEKPGPDGRRRDGGLRHGRQWNKSADGEQANLGIYIQCYPVFSLILQGLFGVLRREYFHSKGYLHSTILDSL